MKDRSEYIAVAVDIDGEVNLIRKDGTVETLFPRGTVEGMSEVSVLEDSDPVSWLFYFFPAPMPRDPKVRRLHLDYLEQE